MASPQPDVDDRGRVAFARPGEEESDEEGLRRLPAGSAVSLGGRDLSESDGGAKPPAASGNNGGKSMRAILRFERFQRGLLLAAAVVLSAPSLVAGDESGTAPQEQFQGRVIDAAGQIPGRSSEYLTLRIVELSPDEEVAHLLEVLQDGGQDALLRELWSTRAKGWVKIGNGLAYDLAVIRSIETENGRVIRALTDRPIQMIEYFRPTRSRNYPFGIIELRLDADGKGSGSLVLAAQAEFTADGSLKVKSFGIEPLRVLKVRPQAIRR
jgi:hypothetical protein